MVDDAESNREADLVKRNAIETRNTAESSITNAERQVKDGGDNLNKELVEHVNAAISELKTALATDNITPDEIKTLTDTQFTATMDLGASQYASDNSRSESASAA